MKSKHFALGISIIGIFVVGAKEARAACGSGLACEVCDNGYSPTQMAAPIGPMTGDCTDQDISAFDTACLATSATAQTCQTWQSSASSACVGCLFTQDTAAQWGFLVCTASGCSINEAGCVDVALGTVSQEKQAGGAGSCGDLVNANFGCQDYACGTCSSTDFAACDQSATTNECASYVAPVESTTGACAPLNNGDAGNAALCFPQDENGDVAMATFICGGAVAPPSDGGTTTPDSGTKTDAGTTKSDGGKSGDAGGDAGGSFGSNGGCHCDVAGGGGDSLALVGVGAAFAATLARRKRRRA